MAQERILVVDDDQSMVQFLSVLLKREGYEVLLAGSGPEAIELLKETPADAVITDLKMPGMDGIVLLEEIKKIDETLPVIIMTAYASQRSAIDALNLGAFQYLEKHAKNEDIKLVIRNALAMRKVPGVNVSWMAEVTRQFEDIDVAVAVATPGGLITPIVRHADQKGLAEISNEMKDLAGRARDGKLSDRESVV